MLALPILPAVMHYFVLGRDFALHAQKPSLIDVTCTIYMIPRKCLTWSANHVPATHLYFSDIIFPAYVMHVQCAPLFLYFFMYNIHEYAYHYFHIITYVILLSSRIREFSFHIYIIISIVIVIYYRE
jgi:hypothetical protein